MKTAALAMFLFGMVGGVLYLAGEFYKLGVFCVRTFRGAHKGEQ